MDGRLSWPRLPGNAPAGESNSQSLDHKSDVLTTTPPSRPLHHRAGYGHHQLTSSQQFYDLLYNKFNTSRQKFATSQHLDMSRCWALALRCGKFVVQQVDVELLWACPLVVLYNMSVAGVRGVWHLCHRQLLMFICHVLLLPCRK